MENKTKLAVKTPTVSYVDKDGKRKTTKSKSSK